MQINCYNCHFGEQTEKGFSVASYDSLMKGSQNGAMIVASDPTGSKLYLQVLSGRMPKRGSPRPTAEQLQLIKQWIQARAQNN